MLQYAVPNAPHQAFQRPPSIFADPPPANTDTNDTRHSSSDTSNIRDSHDRRPPENRIQAIGELHLSALASAAASASAAVVSPLTRSNTDNSTRSTTPTHMASAQFAPAATAGGTTQNSPPVCGNCQTSTTPLWRRDESGAVLCNACGLFLKLHGRPRPISLKTDVIKSRNRVKTAQPKKRDSHGGQDGLMHTIGHTTAYADGSHIAAHSHVHGLPMGIGEAQPRMPSPGTGSRSNTPALAQQNPNIAPQHIFETASLSSDTFASPSLPSFGLRNPSPAPSTLNGSAQPAEHNQSYEAIINHNNSLRTRVSELEVINDLFRGRVAELESSEQAARRDEGAKDDEVRVLRADLAAATARAADLERRLAELETEGPARKKSRTDAGSDGEVEHPAASDSANGGDDGIAGSTK